MKHPVFLNNNEIKMPNRQYKYDTMRFLLIFLVVLGHCIEQFNDGIASVIYRIIYSFHMPMFMFISGNFAKFRPKIIIKHLVIPYLVFQTLYIYFSSSILKTGDFVLQYTTPYWLLWYLLTIIIYYLLIPILPQRGLKNACGAIAVTFMLALLVGFFDDVGYYMSLSRIIVFFPFFVCGFYLSEIIKSVQNLKNIKLIRKITLLISVVIVIYGEYYLAVKEVSWGLLYGSYSYNACGGGLFDRIVYLATSMVWIVLSIMLITNKKIPFISDLGQNTMPVFLLHGFIIRMLGMYSFFCFSIYMNLLLSCIISMAIIILVGNPYFGKVFRKIF